MNSLKLIFVTKDSDIVFNRSELNPYTMKDFVNTEIRWVDGHFYTNKYTFWNYIYNFRGCYYNESFKQDKDAMLFGYRVVID